MITAFLMRIKVFFYERRFFAWIIISCGLGMKRFRFMSETTITKIDAREEPRIPIKPILSIPPHAELNPSGADTSFQK